MSEPVAEVWQVAAVVRFDSIEGAGDEGPLRPLSRRQARQALRDAGLADLEVDVRSSAGPNRFQFNVATLTGAVMGDDGRDAVLGFLGQLVAGRFIRQGMLYLASDQGEGLVHDCVCRQDDGRTVSTWRRLV